MRKETIQDKLVIRPSSLSTFLNCPYKWYLHHIEKIPTIPNAIMVTGTAVHKGAEVGYTEKIQTKKLPPVDVLTDAAVEEFKEKIKEAKTDEEDISKYEKAVVEDTKLYHSSVMKQVEPVAVEKRYVVKLDNPFIEEIGGTADIVLKNGIGDIKLTLRKAVADRYKLQLSTYAILAERVEGKPFNYAEIHNIVNEKSAYIIPVSLALKQTKFIINNLIDSVTAVLSGQVLPEIAFRGNPTSFLCDKKYCDFYDRCPFVKGKNFP